MWSSLIYPEWLRPLPLGRLDPRRAGADVTLLSFQAPPCFLCSMTWQTSISGGGAWERGRLLVCTHDIEDRLIVPASDHSLWSDLQGSTAPFKGWRLNIGFSCVWYNMDYQPPDQPGKHNISVADNGPFRGVTTVSRWWGMNCCWQKCTRPCAADWRCQWVAVPIILTQQQWK